MDSYMQKNETRPPSYTVHTQKINSKCIKDLNISLETINLLEEESLGSKISDSSHSNIFQKYLFGPRQQKKK